MNAEIRIDAADQVAECTDLWEWLRAERALAGSVHAKYRPARDDELGGVLDVLSVALGSGGAGVALARSLTAWLQSRHSDIRVTVSTEAGCVAIDARRVRNSEVTSLLTTVLGAQDER
jgi:hypothetical protein